MFTAHSAAFVRPAPARFRESRAMRGIPAKSPGQVPQVTGYRHLGRGERKPRPEAVSAAAGNTPPLTNPPQC